MLLRFVTLLGLVILALQPDVAMAQSCPYTPCITSSTDSIQSVTNTSTAASASAATFAASPTSHGSTVVVSNNGVCRDELCSLYGIRSWAPNGWGVYGYGLIGVLGESPTGDGVKGEGFINGVVGVSQTLNGVMGVSRTRGASGV
jgi:hypothetical protein